MEPTRNNSSKSPKSTTYCDTHNFENLISLRKFLRALTSHPSQPLFTTYTFSKKWTSRRSFLRDSTSHPSQPLIATHIISKIESLAESFCEPWQVTQVNHCLQHTYFPKLNLSKNFLAKLNKSPKSTTVYNTYIFQKWPSRRNFCKTQQVRRISF